MALVAAVLTDIHWLRQITIFQDGLPGLVCAFQARGRSDENPATAQATPRARLVAAAVAAQDLRVLDALDRLAAQPHYARDIHFDGTEALAAGQGRLNALQWLLSRRRTGVSSSEPAISLLEAVLKGSGDVATATWLVAHCPEAFQTISPAALATAAANGHLGIIKWTHNATRFESAFQASAMDSAAANGHSAVLAFLHEHRREDCTPRAPVEAAQNGHLDVLRLLFAWYPHLFSATSDVLDAAAASTAPTRLAMIQFLHETTQTRCTVAAVDTAAARGDLDAVAYLLKHRREGFSCLALVSAARAGDVEMLRLLLQYLEREHDSTVDLTRAITAAAGQPGQLDAVRLLLDHVKAKPQGNVSGAIRVAAAWGHVEIVRLLVAEGEWVSLLDAVSQASYQGHHEIVALLKQATQARQAQTAPAPPAY